MRPFSPVADTLQPCFGLFSAAIAENTSRSINEWQRDRKITTNKRTSGKKPEKRTRSRGAIVNFLLTLAPLSLLRPWPQPLSLPLSEIVEREKGKRDGKNGRVILLVTKRKIVFFFFFFLFFSVLVLRVVLGRGGAGVLVLRVVLGRGGAGVLVLRVVLGRGQGAGPRALKVVLFYVSKGMSRGRGEKKRISKSTE